MAEQGSSGSTSGRSTNISSLKLNDEWEYSKENIQPLRKGRNIGLLQKTLQMQKQQPVTGVESVHEKEREEFEKRLQSSEMEDSDDPLELWLEYIKWNQEAYPSGNNPKYIEVLERCNNEFKEDERYKNDPRYLRNWLTYANCCSDPTDVYTFLRVNEIGTSLALLYEAWAGMYENRGFPAKADKVYEEGIRMNARPIERLKKRHREFQIRLTASIKKAEEERAEEEEANSGSIGRRSANSNENHVAGIGRSGVAGGVAGAGKSRSKAKPGELQLDPKATKEKSQFAVFVDDEFESISKKKSSLVGGGRDKIGESAQKTKSAHPQREAKKEWKSLAGRDELLKENVHKPTTWNTTLNSKADAQEDSPVPPPKLEFKVFDEKIDKPDKANVAVPVARKVDRPILSVNFNASESSSSGFIKKLKDTKVPVGTKGASSGSGDAKTAKVEKKGYDEDLLFFNGEETCFEEIRAFQYALNVEEGYDSADNQTQMYDITPALVKVKTPGSTRVDKMKKRKYSMGQSPTINTKAALDDIVGMFNNPIHSGVENEEEDEFSDREEVTSLLTNEVLGLGSSKIEIFNDDELSSSEDDACVRPSKSIPSRAGDLSKKLAGLNIHLKSETGVENMPARKGLSLKSDRPDAISYESQSEVISPQKKSIQVFCSGAISPGLKKNRIVIPSDDENDIVPLRSEVLPKKGLRHGLIDIGKCSPLKFSKAKNLDDVWDSENIAAESAFEKTPPPPQKKSRTALEEAEILSPVTELQGTEEIDSPVEIIKPQRESSSPMGHPKEFLVFEEQLIDRKTSSAEPHAKEALVQHCEKVVDSDDQEELSPYLNQPLSPIMECPDERSPSEFEKKNVVVDSFNPFSVDVLESLSAKNLKTLEECEHVHFCDDRSGPQVPDKLPKNHVIYLGTESYSVQKVLGQGAYAKVYLAGSLSKQEMVAMKIQSPPNVWEIFISLELEKRLQSFQSPNTVIYAEEKLEQYFCFIQESYIYNKKSYLLAPVFDQGSLLDIVNLYKRQGLSMDESLVMFYTIELLRLVEILHSNDIIHGDIKPDNLMIRNEESEEDDEDLSHNSFNTWTPQRPGMWAKKGLKLIDCGRSIDLLQFPESVKFEGTSGTSGFQCIQMQKKKPWKYQVDLYGVLSTVHCLLFNDYMQVEQTANGVWKPRKTFKRYWQAPLWSNFFQTLLNFEGVSHRGSVAVLRDSRLVFESFLIGNPSKTENLKFTLNKQKNKLYENM
eukprot:Nk52_evm19s228 gene=Nk52_evmTU19s228